LTKYTRYAVYELTFPTSSATPRIRKAG